MFEYLRNLVATNVNKGEPVWIPLRYQLSIINYFSSFFAFLSFFSLSRSYANGLDTKMPE